MYDGKLSVATVMYGEQRAPGAGSPLIVTPGAIRTTRATAVHIVPCVYVCVCMYVCVCVCIGVYVCVPTLICRLTHWNHKKEIRTNEFVVYNTGITLLHFCSVVYMLLRFRDSDLVPI